MVTTTELDLTILRQTSIGINTVGSISGGSTTVGSLTEAVDYPFGGFLTVQFGYNILDTREHHLYWNKLARRLAGGHRDIIVPIRTEHLMPRGVTGTVTEVAAAQAALVKFRVVGGPSLVGGEWFSIAHATHRTYGIAEILSEVDEGGGSFLYTATIAPYLRKAVAVGDVLDFSTPKCLMRLHSTSQMFWRVNLPQVSRPDLAFIEARWL